jgi:hypothetical protein
MKLDMKLKLVLLAAIMICSCEMPDADEGVPGGSAGRDLIVQLSLNGIGDSGTTASSTSVSTGLLETEIRRTVVPGDADTSALNGSITHFKISITNLPDMIIQRDVTLDFTLKNIFLRNGDLFVIRAYEGDPADGGTLLASARKTLLTSDVNVDAALPYRIALSLLPDLDGSDTPLGSISLALEFPTGIATTLSAQLISDDGSTIVRSGSVAISVSGDTSSATVTYSNIPAGTYSLILRFTKYSYTSTGSLIPATVGIFTEGVNVWGGYTSSSWLDNNSSPTTDPLPTVRIYTENDFASTDSHVIVTLATPGDATQTIGLTQDSDTDSSSVWTMSYADVRDKCPDGNLKLGIELKKRGQRFTGTVYKTSMNSMFSLQPASMTQAADNMHFEILFGDGTAANYHFTPATYLSLTVNAEDGASSRNYTIRFDETERKFFTGSDGAEGNSGFSSDYPLPLNAGVNAVTNLLSSLTTSNSNLTTAEVVFVNDVTAGSNDVAASGMAVLSFSSAQPKIVLSGLSDSPASTFSGGGLNTVLYVGSSANVTLGENLVISGGGGKDFGGGVHVASGGTFTMSGGEIKSNNALIGGGGVYIEHQGTFTMSGGEIKNNNAISSGGGVYIEGEYTYTYNDYIYRYRGGTFNMSGGTISANYSAGTGGGIYVGGGSSTSYGATFTKTGGSVTNDNNAAGAGKTLYVDTNGNSSNATTDAAF